MNNRFIQIYPIIYWPESYKSPLEIAVSAQWNEPIIPTPFVSAPDALRQLLAPHLYGNTRGLRIPLHSNNSALA